MAAKLDKSGGGSLILTPTAAKARKLHPRKTCLARVSNAVDPASRQEEKRADGAQVSRESEARSDGESGRNGGVVGTTVGLRRRVNYVRRRCAVVGSPIVEPNADGLGIGRKEHTQRLGGLSFDPTAAIPRSALDRHRRKTTGSNQHDQRTNRDTTRGPITSDRRSP